MLRALEEKGVAGHIGGHFFDVQGREPDMALTERMIGVDAEDLKRCRETICIAFGEKKAEAVLGAVRGGYVKTLIIDDKCADNMMKYMSG